MLHSLSAAELLLAWERGLAQPPVQRALTLLMIAWPEHSRDTLAALSIGQRDTWLLALRETLFGPQVTSLATCPACGDQLEFDFAVSDILAVPSRVQNTDLYMLNVADCEIQFRLPNSVDLQVIADVPDIASARHELFTRCIVQGYRHGEQIPVNQLPDQVVSAVAEHMAQLDPQADVQLALTCPACANQWAATFDIGSYLWGELNAWALRLLREVHSLAAAYGWREADILAMNSIRRHCYLEMIG